MFCLFLIEIKMLSSECKEQHATCDDEINEKNRNLIQFFLKCVRSLFLKRFGNWKKKL